MSKFPSISVLMPTLNAARVLEESLSSIASQDYPKELVDIIIADAGSTDETVKIAKKFGAKIFENPLKTGEAGKAVALRQAQGELVALIDSDNILPTKDWFRQMVRPFSDPEIIGSEPWQYTWRKEDGFITRYCALIGMNDPLVMFLGNYDRLNLLSGRWTELEVAQEDKGPYIEIKLLPGLLPTIGANGTFLRRNIFENHQIGDYLFDIDVLYDLAQKNLGPVKKFAKVKVGIIHLYCGSSILQFIRKQRRRIKDYLYYEKLGVRKYPWRVFGWSTTRGRGLLIFIFSTATIFPLFLQSLLGFRKKKDGAWFFHPLACLITLFIYGHNWIARVFFGVGILDRRGYGQ